MYFLKSKIYINKIHPKTNKERKMKNKILKNIFLLIFLYLFCLFLVICLKPESYQLKKEAELSIHSISSTESISCMDVDTIYYTMDSGNVNRIINFGSLDEKVYKSIGITVKGKYIIEGENIFHNPIILKSSLNNKTFIELKENYKYIGSMELGKRTPIFQKACLDKSLMPITGQFKSNIKFGYSFEENIFFSALKLLIILGLFKSIFLISSKLADIFSKLCYIVYTIIKK